MKTVRLNPRLRINSWHDGDLKVTHEPVELTNDQADKVLGSLYKGLPLAVLVDEDEIIEEAAPEEEAVDDTEEDPEG